MTFWSPLSYEFYTILSFIYVCWKAESSRQSENETVARQPCLHSHVPGCWGAGSDQLTSGQEVLRPAASRFLLGRRRSWPSINELEITGSLGNFYDGQLGSSQTGDCMQVIITSCSRPRICWKENPGDNTDQQSIMCQRGWGASLVTRPL